MLDALDWKGYMAVILLKNGVPAQNSGRQTPASDTKRWLNEQNCRSGGTDFKIVLEPALATIQASIAAGSNLHVPESDHPPHRWKGGNFNHYVRVQQQAKTYDAAVFTYSSGSGADTTVTERLSCENRGIFRNVRETHRI